MIWVKSLLKICRNGYTCFFVIFYSAGMQRCAKCVQTIHGNSIPPWACFSHCAFLFPKSFCQLICSFVIHGSGRVGTDRKSSCGNVNVYSRVGSFWNNQLCSFCLCNLFFCQADQGNFRTCTSLYDIWCRIGTGTVAKPSI